MTDALLTLIATPENEERLVDWLLLHGHGGFTSLPCAGHGVSGERLRAAEQVAGRQAQVAFWIQLPLDAANALIDALEPAFGRSGMHYWISRVDRAGPLRSDRTAAPASPTPGAR